MSAERKPVDVLAIMESDAHCARESRVRNYDAQIVAACDRKSVAARAAFTELVEADVEYDAARAALEEYYRTIAEAGYVAARQFDARSRQERFVSAELRREKALDAVHGGSPA